jgi:hypothetical protein
LETIKIGDTLHIDNNPELGQAVTLNQNPRTVTGINTLDSVQTNNYPGPGITSDSTILRPITWCKQSVDKFINGSYIGKDRIEYEPQIYPASYIIQPISISTSTIYVDSVRPLFNLNNEAAIKTFQNNITVLSQDEKVGASATATVSVGGSITALNIVSAGAGYTSSTTVVTISGPGIGTTALAVANVSGGIVTSFTISESGTGYTSTSLPSILIQPPVKVREEFKVSSYVGDYGEIVGFNTTNDGSQNRLIFDLFIPPDSFMRDPEYVGTGITISGIGTGDYLTIFDTNINVSVGGTLETQNTSGNQISIATTFSDAVYQVQSVSTELVNVVGQGMTAVRRITTNVGSMTTVSYGSTSTGQFSWGKITGIGSFANSFPFYGENGYSGISTSGYVTRSASLKYNNYT